MNSKLLTRLPLVLAISAATNAWANSDAHEQQTIQVWGTEVRNDSLMMDEGDIEIKQADHLSDLLRDQPGVDIGGAHSTNQRINIRGMQDLDLEVTIDGARQTNFMYHHMGNLLINADILKAVDVQVGTNSVINGGLSGGVAFETKDAQDLLKPGQTVGARIHAGFASNDNASLSLTGYGQLSENIDAMAYITRTNRNNPEDGNGDTSIGNDGDITNALFKFGVDVDENNRLELSYDKYGDEGNYNPRPDMGVLTNDAISSDTVYPTEYDRETVTLGYELDLGDNLNLSATLYRNEMELMRDEDLNSRATYRFKTGSSTHTGLNLLAETLITSGSMDHTLRYGVDHYKLETELTKDGVFDAGEEATSSAFYIEDEIGFENGATLTPGVRYNRYKLDSDASDKTFTETTFGLAAEVPVTDNFSVRAAGTQLFQGPNLAEVYTSAGGDVTPNPDLKAETGHNTEIGFNYSADDVMNLDNFSAGLTVFRTRINDYIDDEGRTASFNNIGNYDIEGFEAVVAMSKGNLDARLTYARSESENRVSGAPLGRQVGDSISLGLDYQIPSADLNLSWTSLVTLDEDYYDKEGFDVHSISAKWTPGHLEGLTLTAGVENLFDEYYTSHASRIGDTFHPVFGQLHLNDYEPGRNFKLSASYIF